MESWQITQTGTSSAVDPPTGTDPLAAVSVVTTADSAVAALDDPGSTRTHSSTAAAGATLDVSAAPSTEAAAAAATGGSGTTGAAARATTGATGCGIARAAGATAATCKTRAGAIGTAELAASTLATTKATFLQSVPNQKRALYFRVIRIRACQDF